MSDEALELDDAATFSANTTMSVAYDQDGNANATVKKSCDKDGEKKECKKDGEKKSCCKKDGEKKSCCKKDAKDKKSCDKKAAEQK